MGRHTLTLDEDVETFLADEQSRTGAPFKRVVNDLLREVRQRRLGDAKQRRKKPYSVKALSVGRVRYEVTSVSEALEYAEGSDFR